MKFLISISVIINKISEKAIIAFLAVMTIASFSQIVSRYCFQTGITWSEELSRYLMVWMVFIGAGVVAREGSHISVTLLEDLYPKVKQWLAPIQKIIALVYLVIIGWIAIEMLDIAKLQSSPNMGVPMHLIYIVIPLSAAIMILHTIIGLYQDLKGGK